MEDSEEDTTWKRRKDRNPNPSHSRPTTRRPTIPLPTPAPYYAPPRNTMDMPLVALIVSLVGLVYWCPPFVLPGITLYLVSKAKKEMAAGVPAGPSSETYLNIARILAIIEICLAGMIVVFYAAIIIMATVTS